MKKWIVTAALALGILTPASAQWRDVKGKWVTGFYVGSNYNPFNNSTPDWYQLSMRETRYITKRIGLGAEAGFLHLNGSTSYVGPISANFYGHLRVFSGFYGEYGYGFTGSPNTNNSGNSEYSAQGAYWALGFTKKFGSNLALDLQYRSAPTPQILGKDYSKGFRLGLVLKF